MECEVEASLPHILVPNLRPLSDEAFQQFAALLAIEIDHLNPMLAQPVDAALERPALAHHHRADPELPHQPAAIPARSQRCHHYQVPITALPPRAPERIRLSVHTGVPLLHPAIMPAADQLPRFREDRGANRNPAFEAPIPRLFQRKREHLFVSLSFGCHVAVDHTVTQTAAPPRNR